MAGAAAPPDRAGRRGGGLGPIEVNNRGWSALGAAAGLATAARMLGVLDLMIMAATVLALVVAAAGRAVLRRPGVELRRSLRPALARVGDPAAAEVHLHNPTRRRVPAVRVTDPIGDGPRTRLRFDAVEPGGTDLVAYPLPTDRRGVHRVGPATVSVTDVFGLVSRSAPVGAATTFTVGPRVHPLAVPPPSLDLRAGDGARTTSVVGAVTGGDLRGLRGYETGDELRRIHWPTTARTGALMVRQDHPDAGALVSIAVDVRPGAHDPPGFESACEVVASVAAVAWAHGQAVRVLTTAGDELVIGGGGSAADLLSARLATLSPDGPDGPDRLALTADLMARDAPWSLPVVVTGTRGADGDRRLGVAVTGGGPRPWILVSTGGEPVPVPGAVVVDGREGRFARSWDRAVSAWTPA